MKKMTEKSLREIGHFLGGRDHSTVMHAIEKIESRVQTDQEFIFQIKRIEKEIIG